MIIPEPSALSDEGAWQSWEVDKRKPIGLLAAETTALARNLPTTSLSKPEPKTELGICPLS